jgi:hypothetical protein
VYGLGDVEMGLEVAYEALMVLLNLALFFGVWCRKERWRQFLLAINNS